MPNPTASDVHVSRPLTNISIAFIQSADAFVCQQVFPQVPVEHQGDQYYVWHRADWYRIEAQKRADATESAGGGFRLTTDNYFAEVWAFHKDVSDRQRRNSDAPINLDRAATRYVTRQLLLRKESEWASTYFATGIWTTDLVGAVDFTQWDLAASTPVDDITGAALTVESTTGFLPNTLVITPRVLNALKNNASILDRIKHTQRGQLTVGLLAGLFEVERVVLARAIVNTAAENVDPTVRTMDYLMGNNALLLYVNPTPSLEEPSAGYTFSWTGVGGGVGGDSGIAMKTFRMEELEADRNEGQMAFDLKLVAPDLGVFFDAAIS